MKLGDRYSHFNFQINSEFQRLSERTTSSGIGRGKCIGLLLFYDFQFVRIEGYLL
jgi:hypothetical protein